MCKKFLFFFQMSGKGYKIGQLARLCSLTERTIRYYDELGLLKSKTRTVGGQRIYSDDDIVYIKRIMELKALSFSLDEIKSIILMGEDDESGEKRRQVLLSNYRTKLEAARRRRAELEREIGELDWHIRQLESSRGSFKDCPGSLCPMCAYKSNCSFCLDSEDASGR